MATKTSLITGATAGFGEAIAHHFAQRGDRLIITGRRKDKLENVANTLRLNYGVEVLPLNFDVRDRIATEKSLLGLPTEWKNIDILVNNAGLASGLDLLNEGDPDDWDKMIDTNVKGLLYVSKSIIPGMVDRKSGHVVNIGSTAGKEVYQRGNVYCASKHAVDALTKGMRIDLLGKGIKVTQIAPGAAETEFSTVRFHGDVSRAKHVYDGYTPMSAEDIAHLAVYVTSLPPHLCINDLVVTSLDQANSFYTHKED
ncbi:MAG: SDR family NAD(P)-dependent oxidoreductase [Flavobacteriales bacterium]|nr:SDR family NAD(P)-dependent oxidoreductase [Flavobacteriales bacterium]